MTAAVPTCRTAPLDPDIGVPIAILCHGGGGGSTRAAIDLAAALERRDHRVLLLTLGQPRWAPPARLRHVVLPNGRPTSMRLDLPWDAPSIAVLARAIAAICRRDGIGLLHFHYGLPFAAAAAEAAAILGPRAPAIVATLHGSDITTAARDPAVRRPLADALRSAAAVSTVSTAYVELLRSGIDDLPAATVVPNFIADDRTLPSSPPPRHGRVPTIIHVSNFRGVKDARSVARTFLAVRRRRRCRLLLVGDGPDWGGMRGLLRQWPDDVRMPGFCADVPALLREADLMLLTSRAESFSLAALEAMAAGVPVVAPRVGGLPEVVGDGIGGLLFHPGRIADASAKVLALLGSPIRLRRMAEGARRRAGRFREAEVVASYEGLYRSALARAIS